MDKYNKINKKKFWIKEALISLLFFLFVYLSLNYSFKAVFEQQKLDYLKNANSEEVVYFNHSISTLKNIANLVYNGISKNKEVENIIYKASIGNPEEQANYRKLLESELKEQYEFLKKNYNIRQFHFHLKNSVSFLRFHKPEKYGDSLVEFRKSIVEVNKTHKPVSVFEEGRVFNGFRNVYPIFHNKEFIGSFEISFGIDAIRHIFHLNDKSNEIFLMSNSVVDKKLFEGSSENYSKSPFGEEWLLDKHAFNSTLKEDSINENIINIINKKISKEEDGICLGCIKDIKVNNKTYTINVIPVENIDKKVVGAVLRYKEDNFLKILEINKKTIISFIAFTTIIISVLFYLWLVSRAKRAFAIELELNIDSLTGARNRKVIEEIFPSLLKEKRKVQFIFFDLDKFKSINDTYGHLIGDEALKSVVNIVKENTRKDDLIVRWGGEEFVLMIENEDSKSALVLAEKIRQAVENSFHTQQNIKLTCSFGVTDIREGDTVAAVTGRTDKMLYQAKNEGRNRIISDI